RSPSPPIESLKKQQPDAFEHSGTNSKPDRNRNQQVGTGGICALGVRLFFNDRCRGFGARHTRALAREHTCTNYHKTSRKTFKTEFKLRHPPDACCLPEKKADREESPADPKKFQSVKLAGC